MPKESLIDDMKNALIHRDGNLLFDAVRAVDEIITRDGSFSDTLLSGLLDVLALPELCSSDDAAAVLKILEYNLGFLPEKQAAVLLDALKQQYENYIDRAACILACEIIVDHLPADGALEALVRYSRSAAVTPRGIAATGLRYLLKSNPPDSVAAQALQRLTAMKSDPSELVREEAEDALKWVALKRIAAAD